MSCRRSDKSHLDAAVFSSINGTAGNVEQEIIIEDDESESSADNKKKKSAAACSYNKSAFSMPDDIKKLMERVLCCSCGKQLNPMNTGAVQKHPWLKVVTCKKCYKFLKSGPITHDKDGSDEQCRWCGDGGHLYGCDFCNNCFCHSCIKRNLGRSEAAAMESEGNTDKKWKCCVCKPKKIAKLVEDCNKIIGYVEKVEQKEKEREERTEFREKEKHKAKENPQEETRKEHARNDAKVENEQKSKSDKHFKYEKTDVSTTSIRYTLPAPKDMRKLAEKKEQCSKKTLNSEVIVVDDSPLSPELNVQVKSSLIKADHTKSIKNVTKSCNWVKEKIALPKSTMVFSTPIAEKFRGQIQKSMNYGMLNQPKTNLTHHNLNRGTKIQLPPPNDITMMKNVISAVTVENIVDRMQKLTQSLNLILSTVSTNLAIAKLTSPDNMFQAKTVAAYQMKNGMELLCNSLREIFNVQLITNSPQLIGINKENGTAIAINPKVINSKVKTNKAFTNVVEIQDSSSDVFVLNDESVEKSLADVIEVDPINETTERGIEQYTESESINNKVNEPIFVEDSMDNLLNNQEYGSLIDNDTETATKLETSKSDFAFFNFNNEKNSVNDADSAIISRKSQCEISEVLAEDSNNEETIKSINKSQKDSTGEEDMEIKSSNAGNICSNKCTNENKIDKNVEENDVSIENFEILQSENNTEGNIELDRAENEKSSQNSKKESSDIAIVMKLDLCAYESVSLRNNSQDGSEGISDCDDIRKSAMVLPKENRIKDDEIKQDVEVVGSIDSQELSKRSRIEQKSEADREENSCNVDTKDSSKKSIKENKLKDIAKRDCDNYADIPVEKLVNEHNKDDVKENELDTTFNRSTDCKMDNPKEDCVCISDSDDVKITTKMSFKGNTSKEEGEMQDNIDFKKFTKKSLSSIKAIKNDDNTENGHLVISPSIDSKKHNKLHKRKKWRNDKEILNYVDAKTLAKISKTEDKDYKSDNYSEGMFDSDSTENCLCAEFGKSRKFSQKDETNKVSDNAEEIESTKKLDESLNIAAEIELLKELTDEISDNERKRSDDSQEIVSTIETDTESDSTKHDASNRSRTKLSSQTSRLTEEMCDDMDDEENNDWSRSVLHGKNKVNKSKTSDKEEKKKDKKSIEAAKHDNFKGVKIDVDEALDSVSGSASDDSDSSVPERKFGQRKKKRDSRHSHVEASETHLQKQDTLKSSRSSSSKNHKSSFFKDNQKQNAEADTDSDDFIKSKAKSNSKEIQFSKKKKDNQQSEKKKKQDDDSDDDKIETKLKQSSYSDCDFDSDLEKEIISLSKETKLSKKKAKRLQQEKDQKQKNKVENKKSKEKELTEGESQSFDSEDDDEDDEASDSKPNSDDGDDDDDNTEKDLSPSQIEKLKQQAEKDSLTVNSDSDEDDDDNSDDDDNDEDISSGPEVTSPKFGTSKRGKKSKINDNDMSNDSNFVTPKKKPCLRNRLLDTKLTDSEEESGRGKKKANKRKKTDTEDDELEKNENEPLGKRKKRRRVMASSSDENEPADITDDDAEEDGTPGGYLKRRKIRKVQSTKKLAEETKAAQKAEEERRKRIEERQKEYNSFVEVLDGDVDDAEKVPKKSAQELVQSSPVSDNIAEIFDSPRKIPVTTKCVLELDKDKNTSIEVNKTLVKKLKPHQVEAVRFMYNCCVESVDRIKKDEGTGCILAHCMGLGKTLSVITFIHTMLSNVKLTNMSTCLVVCPLNTVLNWVHEFQFWLDDVDFEIKVYEMSKVKDNYARTEVLKEWHKGGAGVMVIGYDMYRNLVMGSHCKNKKQQNVFIETLADPGPDLVVCDEGHILKNDQTTLSKSMNKIRTKRRIVLTGTPLQNNLGEYHCMVSFVKPSLLGTRREFNNRFANPITNGQCSDSTPADVKVMKRRAHILHELLAGCVQRKDYSALTKYLPPKFEYVISVRLSKIQMLLYEKYLELGRVGDGGIAEIQSKGARLFRDYQALMRIWTHPWVLKLDEIRQDSKHHSSDNDSFNNDTDSDGEDSMLSNFSSSSSSSSSDKDKCGKKDDEIIVSSSDDNNDVKNDRGDAVVKKLTSRWRGNEEGAGSSWMDNDLDCAQGSKEVSSKWWAENVKEGDANQLELSGKLVLLFEILKMCEDIGDKVLVFSQSLLCLDIIEDFLKKIVEAKNGTAVGTTDRMGAGAGNGITGVCDSNTCSRNGKTDLSLNEALAKDDEIASGKKSNVEKDEVQTTKEQLSHYSKSWTKGADYFRMDGSTNSQNRKAAQDMFNNPANFRARLFLISTKAGSLGINLVAANRVIIFDASWNPSHDIQSIFRVYRFGQLKSVYVYRFLAQGTMEEKIYERQVTKQSLSQRVLDEHQIERHFTSSDLQELYKFQPDRLDDPNRKERPLPMLPKDHMLAELMTQNKEWIVTFHEHDSLLENVVDQELNEEEKKAAWEDYENEKKGISTVMYGGAMTNYLMADKQMNMQNLLMVGQTSLGQHLMRQTTQDLKSKFPNLPPEVFQQHAQDVLKQVLTQHMQQAEIQRRQLEIKKMNELGRFHQMKQQIQQQQAMLNNQQQQFGLASRLGGNQFGGGQYPHQMSNVGLGQPYNTHFMPKQGSLVLGTNTNHMSRTQGSSSCVNPLHKSKVVQAPGVSKPGTQK